MIKVKQLTTILCALLATGILSYSVVADDSNHEHEGEEGQVEDFTSLPTAIQSFIAALPKESEEVEVEAENENGVRVYEIEYEIGDNEYSAELTETGDVIEAEHSLPIAKLPKAVTDAIAEKFGDAEVLEAEAGELHFYEIEVKKNGKVHEVKLLANGQLFSDEDDHQNGGNHDNDDHDHDDND